MDVLRIINIDLEDFKVIATDKLEGFKFSQYCAICFKTINSFPLNSLIFQNENLQDILVNTTSCFTSKKLWESSEQCISSCHLCLHQLLTSYLFQLKVQKAYESFKAIISSGINEKEPQNMSDFNTKENKKTLKTEDCIENKPFSLNIDCLETHCQDSSIDNSDSEFCKDDENLENKLDGNENKTYEKKQNCRKKNNDSNISNAKMIKKNRVKFFNLNKTCPICKKVFTRNYNLKNHMFVHTQEARHECGVCLRRFSWPENLKRHMLIHTGEKPFTCAGCGKGFIQKKQLIEHVHLHTGEKLTCEFCGKICRTISTFNRHMKNVHTEKGDVKEKSVQNSKICDVCGKILSSKGALNNHIRTHGEKQFSCEHCERKFTSKISMVTHLKVHTGERPFLCKECGKTFRTSACLNQHTLVHTGKRPYACHLCPKTFRQGQHLQYHLRVHAGIKEFTCDYCGKRFLTNGNLTAHKRIHTDTRPFSCEFCGKTFTASSNLKKHKATHQRSLTKTEIEQPLS